MRKKIKSIFLFIAVIGLLVLLGFPLSMLMGEKQGKVTLDEKVFLPFEVEEEKQVILLYFGYVGCQTICTPSLEEIASIYKDVNLKDNVVFYFINIGKNTGEIDAYLHYFDKSFIGINLNLKEKQKLMNDLRAYTSDSLSGSGEMSHTGYLYMITQKSKQYFELKKMYYTRPFNKQSIVFDIHEELK